MMFNERIKTETKKSVEPVLVGILLALLTPLSLAFAVKIIASLDDLERFKS